MNSGRIPSEGFLKWGYPQVIHVRRIFPDELSIILGYSHGHGNPHLPWPVTSHLFRDDPNFLQRISGKRSTVTTWCSTTPWCRTLGLSPKKGVSMAGTPKWMVYYLMANPNPQWMMTWGSPIFWKRPYGLFHMEKVIYKWMRTGGYPRSFWADGIFGE